ncbi:ThuA domain-containing protein [Fredinandcohnia sp. 179-A 10B2 NHS]|uniref:ThuA domain-containing protein n=1 Tax=Fredinandcohnia sp. 179-A 10B2 NHS TaxID=3235176 RepID=UPI00399F3586
MGVTITAILGDYYHKAELSREALENAVQQLGNEIKIQYSTPDKLLNDLTEKPDAFILFAENRLNPQDTTVVTWMNNETAAAINEYVENGGGWLAWHSGMASYENVEGYISMLRGYFTYHPEKHQIVEYKATPESSYIVEDDTFSFPDEHYFVECDKENTNVLLTSSSVDGESIGGWAHDYGAGRVVCLCPAHLEEGLLHPAFQKILANSLRWCSIKE